MFLRVQIYGLSRGLLQKSDRNQLTHGLRGPNSDFWRKICRRYTRIFLFLPARFTSRLNQ